MSGRARHRRAVLVGLAGAAVLVLVLVGAVLVWQGGRETGSPERAEAGGGAGREAIGPAGRSAGSSSPASTGWGGGVEFSRDETGAAAAAVAYTAASQEWLYLGDDEAAEAVAAIATADAAERLAAEVVEETRTARQQLAEATGRVWWWVHPLACRTLAYGSDSATVEVWTVTVLSAAGVAAPQSEWITVTVDLEWVEGGWRVAAVRDRPGPTPMNGPRDDPWDAGPFDEALAGFIRLGGASAP